MPGYEKMMYTTLNDGNKMPQLGLGTMLLDNATTHEAVLKALKLGYRQFDTAHCYNNEAGVGAAIKESGIPREEIFITDKLWMDDYNHEQTSESIDKMLKRLGTDYIDLLLIHIPLDSYHVCWKDMEKAVADGRVHSIGLSNFRGERLDEIMYHAKIKPAVLQCECHPYFQEKKLREYLKPFGTKLEAWYPLGHGDSSLFTHPVIAGLAEKYGHNSGQIILRWHLQEGTIIFPGYSDPKFLESNLEVFDFELTDEDMEAIRAMDKNLSYYPAYEATYTEMYNDPGAWCEPDEAAQAYWDSLKK